MTVLLLGLLLLGPPGEAERARAYVEGYWKTLPDFVVVEELRRFWSSRAGEPGHLDSEMELELRVEGQRERYRLLRRDGQAAEGEVWVKELGSVGELGQLLRMLFAAEERAEFRAAGRDRRGAKIAVKVGAGSSHWRMYCGGKVWATPAYGGTIWVDETGAVRRVSLEATAFGMGCRLKKARWEVEYGETEVGGAGLLLPRWSEVETCDREGQCARNEAKFGRYRRFGAESKLVP